MVPIELIEPAAISEMNAASIAYSIKSCPDSSRSAREISRFIVPTLLM